MRGSSFSDTHCHPVKLQQPSDCPISAVENQTGPMHSESDSVLVESCRQGDRQAFNDLVLRHQTLVYRVIMKMVNNHDEALDLTQDVFIKAWQTIDTFRGDSLFSTWLYRIATNLTLNHLRRRKIVSFFSMDDTDQREFQHDQPDPHEALENQQTAAIIQSAIDKLPARQRAVFVLRYNEELPYNEISKILGTSIGALKANYFHAMKKVEEYVRNAM
jgi:RNA polymerase sigma-70 factor (ECF subfamily)